MGAIFVGPDRAAENARLKDFGDGDLVFQTGYGEIWAMGASGSEPARLAEERKTYPAASPSPDGEKMAFVGKGGAIYVMDADGSNQIPIFDAAGVQISQSVWQP